MKTSKEMIEYLGIDESNLDRNFELHKTVQKAMELQETYAEQIEKGEMGMGLHADFYGNQDALEGEGKKLSSVLEEDGVILYKIEPLEQERITCKQILLTQLDYMNTILEDVKRSLNDNSKYGLLRNVCENVVDYIGEYIEVDQEPISNTIRIDMGYLYGYLDLENMCIYYNADEMGCEATSFEDLKYEISSKPEKDLLEMDGYGMFEDCLKNCNKYSLEYKGYLDGAAYAFNANDIKVSKAIGKKLVESIDEKIAAMKEQPNPISVDLKGLSYELGKLINMSIVEGNFEMEESLHLMVKAVGMHNIQQKEVIEGIMNCCGDDGSDFRGYANEVLKLFGLNQVQKQESVR